MHAVGLLLVATAVAAAVPSATRGFSAGCVSSAQSYTTTLLVNPGSPPPSDMIVREELPAGWTVISATWNGNPIVTNTNDVSGPRVKKWLFGSLGGPAVTSGTLEYVTRPDAAVERSYNMIGSIAYGTPYLFANITGASELVSCDQDGDGIPDDWERMYFEGNPIGAVASCDSDGDGMTNLHEYLARTNPRDMGSFFGFSGMELDGEHINLRWRAAAGSDVRLFFLERLGSNAIPQIVRYSLHEEEGEMESGPIPTSFYPPGFFNLWMESTR